MGEFSVVFLVNRYTLVNDGYSITSYQSKGWANDQWSL